MMEHQQETRRLRVLTWNINGLRRIVGVFGGLAQLLATLEADVVCFQETKLTRGDLRRELALVEGWESFFAFTRGKVGYSGVATFCRRDVTLPHRAEEGFTGVLELPAGIRPNSAAVSQLLHPRWAAAGLSLEQLRELDGEGRVVITYHGGGGGSGGGGRGGGNTGCGSAGGRRGEGSSGEVVAASFSSAAGRGDEVGGGGLVIVNVYGPAITSEERAEQRMDFKMAFYRSLQLKLDALLAAGHRVLLLGDLNIAPHCMDVCGATSRDFDTARPDRVWLKRLMTRGRGGQGGAAGASGGNADPRGGARVSVGVGCGAKDECGLDCDQMAVDGVCEGGSGGRDKPGVVESRVDEEEEAGVEADRGGCVWSDAGGGGGIGRCGGGDLPPFVDTFRDFHPQRLHAYTCWNTSSGARFNNYGSRIDHILAADGFAWGRAPEGTECTPAAPAAATAGSVGGGAASSPPATPCPSWVLAADIMPDLQGSDHAPVWVDLDLLPYWQPPPAASGSLPPPPLPLSSRCLFDGSRQATLLDCLARNPPPPAAAKASVEPAGTSSAAVAEAPTAPQSSAPTGACAVGRAVAGVSRGPGGGSGGGTVPPRRRGGGSAVGGKGQSAAGGGGGGGSGSGQRKLTAFMQRLGTGGGSGSGGGSAPCPSVPPQPQHPSGGTDRQEHHQQHQHQHQHHLEQQGDGADHPHLQPGRQVGQQPPAPVAHHHHHHTHHHTYPHDPTALCHHTRSQEANPSQHCPAQLSQQGHRLEEGGGWEGGNAARGQNHDPGEGEGDGYGTTRSAMTQGAAEVVAVTGVAWGCSTTEVRMGSGVVEVEEMEGGGLQASDGLVSGSMEVAAEVEVMEVAGRTEETPGRSGAMRAWAQIQQQLKPPRCSGHGEPCVIRTVKKKGDNNGRQFWCCARPDGLPPNGRCDFFQWARGRGSVGPGAGAGSQGAANAGKGAAAGRDGFGVSRGGMQGGAAGGSGGARRAFSNMPQSKKPRV